MSKATHKQTWVALLRGINVGGKNKVPMKELRALFVDAGCEQVETYIQSGNVVFAAPASVSTGLAASISAQLSRSFGFGIPVILRSAAELAAVIQGNPFIAAGVPPETLHVLFLADLPKPELVEALDPDRSPPDSFVVAGREAYLCTPNGVGRSRLTNAWFDSKLSTVSTGRNWRTSVTLLAMATRLGATSETVSTGD